MKSILVPLDNCSDACLKSAYYAIELAKRTNSRIFFLFIFDSGLDMHPRDKANLAKIKDKISAFLDQGYKEPPETEYYLQSEDYCRAVEEFARNHRVSRIVMGLPHHNDVHFEKTREYIQSMKSRVKCQLVVVKAKSSLASGIAGESNHADRDHF